MLNKKSAEASIETPNNAKKATADKKSNEQYDPQGKAIDQRFDAAPGTDYLISVYEPLVVVDSHMHVMSGNCSPLQLVWDRSVKIRSRLLGRKFLMGVGDNAGKVIDVFTVNKHYVPVPGTGGTQLERRKHWLRTSSDVAKKSTTQICDEFVSDRLSDIEKYLSEEDLYKSTNENRKSKNTGELPVPLAICLPLTMDMEFAHLLGYFGLNIYNGIYEEGKWDKPIHYWTPDPDSIDELIKNKRLYSIPKVKTDKQTESEFKESKKDYKREGIPGLYIDNKGQRIRITINATPFMLPDSETDLYEPWKKQQINMKIAMLKNPLKVLPLFHYDPRRWQVEVTGNAVPFSQVTGSGLYLGFKIYTSQGYRPWDVKRLPILKYFYMFCRNNRIPIVNHCTPEGAYTFDRKHYIDFLHPADHEYEELINKTVDPQSARSTDVQRGAGIGNFIKPNRQTAGGRVRKKAADYFNEEFVSPSAWRKVLQQNVMGLRLHSLRICLAHFGGGTKQEDTGAEYGLKWFNEIIGLMKDYPNVYADVSSSLAGKHKDNFKELFKDWYNKEIKHVDNVIRSRILFGTDWYMTLMDNVDYLEYVRDAKSFIDSLDNDLWFQMSQVNPYRFYRLDEQIYRIRDNLFSIMDPDDEDVKRAGLKGYKKNDLYKINQVADLIWSANKPYDPHKEGRK
ncbi:MAG: amidohydrolase family protein [Smithellaceae bacterium]|jgi:hypothetical protein|nr:amidohydrolase family protein [Syntrophaceae bacterium]